MGGGGDTPPHQQKIVGLNLCWVAFSFVRQYHIQNFRPLACSNKLVQVAGCGLTVIIRLSQSNQLRLNLDELVTKTELANKILYKVFNTNTLWGGRLSHLPPHPITQNHK